MPEVPDIQTIELAKNLKQAQADIDASWEWLEDEEIEKIVEKENMVFIGAGSECAVIQPLAHPHEQSWKLKPKLREDVVVAIDYKNITDPIEAKNIFYTHRIMSTLFPHNFPKFFASYGSSDKTPLSGTVRQRVEKRESPSAAIIYPFGRVDEVINELKLPVYFDKGNYTNFMAGKDGGHYYLDKIQLQRNVDGSLHGFWDKASIEGYMTRQGFNDIQKRIVGKSIDRLKQLNSPK